MALYIILSRMQCNLRLVTFLHTMSQLVLVRKKLVDNIRFYCQHGQVRSTERDTRSEVISSTSLFAH